jgi:hypothetical protein
MDIWRRPWITGPGGLGAVGGLILFLLHGLAGAPAASPPVPSPAPSGTVGAEATHRVFLPLVLRSICAPIPGVTYEVFPVIEPVSFNVADNPDYNLLLLGYVPVNEYKGLVDYGGDFDPGAPQLRFLFGDHRIPVILNTYKNNGWDWERHQRLPPPAGWPPVSVVGFAVSPGEILYLPDSGYRIGADFQAHVLYADENQITLKYTAEDSTAQGYTVYITNLCVEPSLLALYRQWNAWGRGQLPALRGGQPLGRARGTQIDVGIRDNNVFMDSRSRKDWWRR